MECGRYIAFVVTKWGIYKCIPPRFTSPAHSPRAPLLAALTNGSTDIDVLSDLIRHLSDGDTTRQRGHIIVPRNASALQCAA